MKKLKRYQTIYLICAFGAFGHDALACNTYTYHDLLLANYSIAKNAAFNAKNDRLCHFHDGYHPIVEIAFDPLYRWV